MIRLQAECRHRELLTEDNSRLKNYDTEHDCSARTGDVVVVIL
jgi:hypothetical protein